MRQGDPDLPSLDNITAPLNGPPSSWDDADAEPEVSDDLNVIVVEGRVGRPPDDPMIELNAAVLDVSLALDGALVEPLAESYRDDLPSPIRRGLANFFKNLTEPVNFINFLLQGKPLQAIETFGRFAINSTLGVGGLVDWAKNDNFNLPYRRNGLANTLGYYGVGPGPFLVLPLVGATTLRDLLGSGVDNLILPTGVGKPFNTLYYAVPAYTVNSLEWRIQFDDDMREIKNAASPYDLMKQFYLERREREINELRGIHTLTMDEQIELDILAEEAAADAAQALETAPAQQPVEGAEHQGTEVEVSTLEQAPTQDTQEPAIEGAQPPLGDADAANDNNIDGQEEPGVTAPAAEEAIGQLRHQSISSILTTAGY